MDIIFGYLQQGASAVLPFIILLGLLIFVHELGHFLVAKYFGVRVEVFSLGFGKKILQYKKGDTTYCLSLIPLGGYVKMFGDEINADISEADKKYSFTHKPVGQRIAVVLAGPLMNFFFAVLIFLVVSIIGEDVRAPKVGDLSSDTQAYKMGFRSGDKIVSAQNTAVRSWDEFQNVLTENANTNVPVQIQREQGDNQETVTATPVLIDNPNLLSTKSKIGAVDGLNTNSKAPLIGVRKDSPASNFGFKTGDKIASIQGQNVLHFRDLENLFVSRSNQNFVVVVERPLDAEWKKHESVSISIPATAISSLASLGLESSELYLIKVIEDSPAAKAGLKENDRILSINGKTLDKWDDLLNQIKAYHGDGGIKLEVERLTGVQVFDIMPQMTAQMTVHGSEEKRYTVGIVPMIMSAAPDMIKLKADGPVSAISRGFQKTVEISAMTILSFVRLLENKISPKNIGGVLSIGQAASETFKIGMAQFLQMMGIISINLFVLNLLPIPVLDGGHLLFYILEMIKGAPVSMRKMEIAQQVGLVVLMSLMVLSLFNDVTRLFSSW